ncbi:hypothetical protein OSB04_013887 [Centaurea solstitialis]|uniref:Uncharacterized protein n=1 Tax=Centaurea solstitialis TaxID=347529 RepID=A0AA38TE31_9ASTR|nr:hypothetical protein OSB04_013887 [Centaurea solstitialis]
MSESNAVIQHPIPEVASTPPQASISKRAPTPMNLPCQDLLRDEKRRYFLDTCIPLYEASITGDWKAAEGILQNNRHLIRYSITEHCETALHIAASAQSNAQTTEFVQNIVQMMEKEDLLLQNSTGNTALCLAAAAGNVEIARIMVNLNEDLLTIPNRKEMMPLYVAALFRNYDMVKYLYESSGQMSGGDWTPLHKRWVYLQCVEVDFFDVALDIFRDHPDIPHRDSALESLAQNPCAFDEIEPHTIWRIINSIKKCCSLLALVTGCKVGTDAKESKAMELLREIWKSIEEKPKVEIDTILRGPSTLIDGERTYPSRVLFLAAEMGNTKFLIELIRRYPDLIWKQNDSQQSIFHVAVSHRRASIYNLLYEIGSTKDFITSLKDEEGNNMLHLVGKKVEKNQPRDVPGVAFQLQRELLWFKYHIVQYDTRVHNFAHRRYLHEARRLFDYIPTFTENAESSFDIFTCRFLRSLKLNSFIVFRIGKRFDKSSPFMIYPIPEIISVPVGRPIYLKSSVGCDSVIHIFEDGRMIEHV